MDLLRLDNQQLQRVEKGLDNVAKALIRLGEIQEANGRKMEKLIDVLKEDKNGVSRQDSGTDTA